MQLKNEIKAAKKLRLPWWGVLWVIFGAALISWLFALLGRFDLARPALCSIAMLGLAIAIKWELRRYAWFWITLSVASVLHVVLILSIPWTTTWVPAVVIIPIGTADLYAILAILSVIGKFAGRPKAPEG